MRRLFEQEPSARQLIDEPLFSFDSPALVHLSSAKEHLESGDEQGCLEDVDKARAELTSERDG